MKHQPNSRFFTNKWTIVLLLLAGLTSMAHAQDDIKADAYSGGHYVLLRWYPQTPDVYTACAKDGYVVERRTVGEAGGWEAKGVVRPGSYSEFAQLARKDKNALVMAYILHEEEMLAHADDFKDLADSTGAETMDPAKLKNPKERKLLYNMGLIACEFNADLAKLSALNFRDDQVQTQARYEYRVRPAGDVKGIKSMVVAVNTGTVSKLAAPKTLEVSQQKKSLQLRWNVAGMQRDYSGYQMERSTDGKNFTRVNPSPILQVTIDPKSKDVCLYVDSLPECGRDYYFRYCGLSRFGLKGPYSNVVKVRCEDDYVVEVKLERVNIDAKGAHLKWKVNNPLNQPVRGFLVDRISKLEMDGEGRFIFDKMNGGKLLGANAREFLDKQPQETNYYRVTAVGQNDKQRSESNVQFMNKADTTPPAPPTGLQGRIDSLGVVTLDWKPNTDPDIYAYRVFFANREDGTYVGVSDTFLLTPHFTDTLFLGSLTNDIYYKVMAIDRNYNQSGLSAPLKLLKPDTIAPFNAVFDVVRQQDYRTGDDVEITWINSPSDDVVKLELWQRIGDNGSWKVLKAWESLPLPEHYTDTTYTNGDMVYYRLTCYDYSGNKRETDGTPVYTREKKKVCAKNLTVRTDYEKGGIRLEWEKNSCAVEKYRIFRTDNGETSLLVTVGGQERAYFDDRILREHTYKYVLWPIADEATQTVESAEVRF